jgi:hypothetical protein
VLAVVGLELGERKAMALPESVRRSAGLAAMTHAVFIDKLPARCVPYYTFPHTLVRRHYRKMLPTDLFSQGGVPPNETTESKLSGAVLLVSQNG